MTRWLTLVCRLSALYMLVAVVYGLSEIDAAPAGRILAAGTALLAPVVAAYAIPPAQASALRASAAWPAARRVALALLFAAIGLLMAGLVLAGLLGYAAFGRSSALNEAILRHAGPVPPCVGGAAFSLLCLSLAVRGYRDPR